MELAFSEFLAKGTVTRNELALSEAEVRAFGGRLLGNARLRWSDGWSLEGDLAVRQMDAAKIAAPLLAGGTLEGKGTYSMKALLPERLLLNLRLEGNFTVQKGSITNVDMTRVLQGSGSGGGTTLFSDMSGSVSVDPNRILVRQIRMAAGLLNSAGQVEMDPQKNLSGRMQIELRAQSVQARATLTVAGTLQNPQFRRSN
jgi:autotransporter translocation and assembly factor TamB